jgi:hypothetical protein
VALVEELLADSVLRDDAAALDRPRALRRDYARKLGEVASAMGLARTTLSRPPPS